jgi:hypothetical protein
MAEKRALDVPQTNDRQALQLVPTPTRRRADLKTLGGVRREMARVYRSAEAGERDASEASKLVFVLGQIGKLIELADVETRLKALEVKHG